MNRAPVAVNDAAGTNENTSTVINVIGNDTDPEGGVLVVQQVRLLSGEPGQQIDERLGGVPCAGVVTTV